MGSADRLIPGFGAAVFVVAPMGCGRQPGHAQLGADARRLHPDCTLMDTDPGEGDSDTVYRHLRFDCTPVPLERRRVPGYRRDTSGWHLFFDDRAPPMPVMSGQGTMPERAQQ